MIIIHTKDPLVLKNKILEAVNSEDEFITWKVISEKFKGDTTIHKFIMHKEDQWSTVVLFMAAKSDNTLEITSYAYKDNDGVFGSKKPHVEGRFTAALLSNMLDEFNRIEYIKD